MRHLLQPRVLRQAAIAAALSTLACYPRLSAWTVSPLPVLVLAATMFTCGIVLWSFVFAWHTPYTGRPVLVTKFEKNLFAAATLAGVVLALICRLWLDPELRKNLPEDYPADLEHWLVTLPFLFGFGLLFLTFAPFDWLMRLCRSPWISAVLTALFGVGISAMRLEPHADAISPLVLAGLLVGRFVGGLLTVFFYLRGGLLLAWWWAFLFELRLLPELL